MVMAAILDKKISSAGIFGDFARWDKVGIKETFLKNSAFYIFFPGWPYFSANAPGLYIVRVSTNSNTFGNEWSMLSHEIPPHNGVTGCAWYNDTEWIFSVLYDV